MLTFQYLDPADLPLAAENSLELKRYTGTGTVFDSVPAMLDISANTVTTTGAISDFSDWTLLSVLAPTAATVSVSGRVMDARKRGIARAQVSITDPAGIVRTVLTNPFGYYHFNDVRAGETYIFQAKSKRYRFLNSPSVRFVSEDLTNFDFTALP